MSGKVTTRAERIAASVGLLETWSAHGRRTSSIFLEMSHSFRIIMFPSWSPFLIRRPAKRASKGTDSLPISVEAFLVQGLLFLRSGGLLLFFQIFLHVFQV